MRIRYVIRRIKKYDERFAAWGTKAFGTMLFFWVCFFYGLLPLVPALHKHEADLLYWSNWVQLWALPLLMVGNIVLSREATRRDLKDHDAIMEILKDIHMLLKNNNIK